MASSPSAGARQGGSFIRILLLVSGLLSTPTFGDVVGPRTGNWTTLACTDKSVTDIEDLSAQQRWNQMDCPDAWKDVLNVWTTHDSPQTKLNFTASISNTIHGPEQANCGEIGQLSNCAQTLQCAGFLGEGSGPAGYELWNSMVIVNEMYSSFQSALVDVAALFIDPSLPNFENTFAPVPPPKSNDWPQILAALLGLGFAVITAPFFEVVLAGLAFFAAADTGLTIAKDVTFATIAFGSQAGPAIYDLKNGDQSRWTPQSQDSFSMYLGQVVWGWSNATAFTLQNLFNGSDTSISTLSTLLQDGHLIEGSGRSSATVAQSGNGAKAQLQASIATAFYSFAIPQLWRAAATDAFVIDSGYPCGTVDPLGAYMSTDTMHATYACYQNKLYYLVFPDGKYSTCKTGSPGGKGVASTCEGSLFTPPHGLATLNGTAWGQITRGELITGSVRSFSANGDKNGGPTASPLNNETLTDLFNADITTPGYINLPVCAVQIAKRAWQNPSLVNTTSPSYPCVQLQGKSTCSGYTYQNQGSDGSPLVSDCLGIINNIAGTNGTWTTGVGQTRTLVNYGTCSLDVQGGAHGSVTYQVGAEDIVEVIQKSIDQFASNGKVGAKGHMSCKGNANQEDVTWGLFHK